jgi:hypothetical protein
MIGRFGFFPVCFRLFPQPFRFRLLPVRVLL